MRTRKELPVSADLPLFDNLWRSYISDTIGTKEFLHAVADQQEILERNCTSLTVISSNLFKMPDMFFKSAVGLFRALDSLHSDPR